MESLLRVILHQTTSSNSHQEQKSIVQLCHGISHKRVKEESKGKTETGQYASLGYDR